MKLCLKIIIPVLTHLLLYLYIYYITVYISYFYIIVHFYNQIMMASVLLVKFNMNKKYFPYVFELI